MKNWIRFGCVALFFALNYSVEVRLERGAGTSEQLFLFTGQKVSYLICLLASLVAATALTASSAPRASLPRRRWPTWAEIPKWPMLAFLLLFATGSWRQDGYAGRDGYITIKYGWFREANLGLYLAVVVTVILVDIALRRSADRRTA
ncbi:MAG: hypothetical protein KF715_12475 [Candidatus Didemnitutus sp.]|nr:hypothetical protein [Candidatus Didemnitutus sp.]